MYVNGILFNIFRGINFDTCAMWLKLENIMLRKRIQTQKDKCCISSFIRGM